ncbi:MAG: hypothetical protein WBG50_14375 [Desulfomonilaceae bacterium]
MFSAKNRAKETAFQAARGVFLAKRQGDFAEQDEIASELIRRGGDASECNSFLAKCKQNGMQEKKPGSSGKSIFLILHVFRGRDDWI